MKLNEYQELGKRTMPPEPTGAFQSIQEGLNVSNYAMGIAGEAGEVVDLLKKIIHHKHATDKEQLKLELGDTLHYLSGIATMCGLTLEDIAKANVEKLENRYPNGFNSADSINREDD